MKVRDVVAEAFMALSSRRSRTLVALAGTAVGVASLVATTGIVRTAGSQVTDYLQELSATTMAVTVASQQGHGEPPDELTGRASGLSGVVAAATRSVPSPAAEVRALPDNVATGSDVRRIPVISGSEGIFSVAGASLASGRFFDAGHNTHSDPVAVVGAAAAQRLGLGTDMTLPVIFVHGTEIQVLGIIDDVVADAEMLSAIVVPDGFARDNLGLTSLDELVIRVVPGSAANVARQLPVALAPQDPATVRVRVAAGSAGRRAAVERELVAMLLLLGGTALLAGAFGIANVSLVGVMERRVEIGLRRALGTHRRHVGGQFLVEAGFVGLLGGLCGAAVGIVVIVSTAAVQGWTPVLDAWLPAAAVAVSTAVGVVAGAYPAWRAAQVQPAEAVRY